jgi:hypothetical protein
MSSTLSSAGRCASLALTSLTGGLLLLLRLART